MAASQWNKEEELVGNGALLLLSLSCCRCRSGLRSIGVAVCSIDKTPGWQSVTHTMWVRQDSPCWSAHRVCRVCLHAPRVNKRNCYANIDDAQRAEPFYVTMRGCAEYLSTRGTLGGCSLVRLLTISLSADAVLLLAVANVGADLFGLFLYIQFECFLGVLQHQQTSLIFAIFIEFNVHTS